MTRTVDLPELNSTTLDRDYLRIVRPDVEGSTGGKEYKIFPNRFSLGLEIFLALPGLRGFWPMSSVGVVGTGNNNIVDVSGVGLHLTYNGNPTFDFADYIPYVNLDGTGDYLSHNSDATLDILGTESYIANPGLTMGGWFYHDNAAGSSEATLSKWGGAGNNSYEIVRGVAGTLNARVSGDGTNTFAAQPGDPPTATWYFAVLRFIPSTEVSGWMNDTKSTNTSSIPASIFDSTADFVVGGRSGGTDLTTGRVALPFLCAAAASDDIINRMFQQTRYLFGV